MSNHPTIGASQISALLGIHPWMTQHDVWKQLVHGIKQEDNEALERGRKWEQNVLDMYERETNRPGMMRNMSDPPFKTARDYLHATPDALYMKPKRLVEAKTSSEQWDLLPAYYHNQVQVQLYCWDYETADLAVLFPHFDFRIFPDILPNPELQGQLNDVAEKFIKDYVLPKKLPPVDASESCRQAIIAQWPKEESDEYLEPSLTVYDALERIKRREPELAELQILQDEDKNILRAFIGEKAGIQFEHGYASFKRNKPSKKTDWEELAWALKTKLGSYEDADVTWGPMLKLCTREVPGPRVLRIQWKKETEE